MIRLLLLSIFLACFTTGYGQGSKTKQTMRLPLDSAMQSSVKRKNMQLIDGSQNVQSRAGGQSTNPYATTGGQQRFLPSHINSNSVATVQKRLEEPKPVFIEREREQSQLKSSLIGGHREATFAFFRETPQLKIHNPELQIRIDTIVTDKQNITHVKGVQLYRDIPVYGMNFTFHISEKNEWFMGYTVDSTYMNTAEVMYSAEEAIRIAEHDLRQTTEIRIPGEMMKKTLNYEHPTAEAIYYPTKSNVYNYTYKVVIRPNFRDEWIYYINALSGEIVEKYNNTPTDGPNTGTGRDLSGTSRTVNTYLENGTHYMVNTTKPMFKAADFSGVIGVYDAKNDYDFHDTGVAYLTTSTSASWNNPTAISAMYYTTLVYDYLQNTFQRKSFDDKGSSMQAIINVCDPDDGLGYENAYWNGAIIALGNGRSVFSCFAGALDIIAHEFGHAVVGNTAKLEYKNQSGAINEAYADIFGVMVDRSNWTIGEDVVISRRYFPSGYMRDMRNPHNGGTSYYDDCWQPENVSEMYLGTDDNGGVHVNNSIPAHTFYLYATATNKERAEQVYYHALTWYLTPTSKFIDFRKAIIQSAKDLNYSSDIPTLENAFDKVGIGDDSVDTRPPADLPSNPGEWGLLLCNTDPADYNSLYKTSDYENITPISTTEMYSTPSVTDDGKFTIFVDNRNNIRILDMTTGKESILNEEGDNQSVAISRDGKRMAVITTYEDGHIWVYDFNSNRWYAFKLYNPTTGKGGAISGGPRWADAIEFDHTGEYLIYDAYNVSGASMGGHTVDYWDIGLIHVWDNDLNKFGTGEVVKLFTELSSGVNVFNPIFAKNSPFVIALDYYDEEDDINATLGVNLATGEVEVMFINNIPSYPNYSMDDGHIAFTTYNYYDEEEDYDVGYFNLGDDKISVTGDEVVFVTGGAYPVYYGTGSRQLGAKPVASFTADKRSGGSPLDVQFVDMSNGKPTSWRWTFQGGSPSSSTQQHPKVTYNTTGIFPVTLVVTNSYGSDEVVRQDYITVGATGSETIAQETVTIYPNPSSDYVWIYSAPNVLPEVRLFDLTGKAIPATITNEQGKIRLDVSHLQRGIYILRLALPNGDTKMHKLIRK